MDEEARLEAECARLRAKVASERTRSHIAMVALVLVVGVGPDRAGDMASRLATMIGASTHAETEI